MTSASVTAFKAEDGAGGARPLRAWTEEQRTRVAQAVATAFEPWRTAWGLPGDAVPPTCAPLREAGQAGDAEEWQAFDDGAAGLWWSLRKSTPDAGGARPVPRRPALLAALAAALWSEGSVAPGARLGGAWIGDSKGTVADEVAEAAWVDLMQRLVGALGGRSATSTAPSGGPPSQQILALWSGALVTLLPWWGSELAVLVSGERVARRVPPAAPVPAAARPLVPIWSALASRGARVRVELRPFQLDLGALAALRVGDVVRTAHPVDEPMLVRLDAAGASETVPICAAYLGKVGTALGAELVAAGAAPVGIPSDFEDL